MKPAIFIDVSFECAKVRLFNLFFKQRLQHRDQLVCISAETYICKMDSVNGSLIVVACQAFTCDIIYILVSVSYKLFIIFTICGILFGKKYGNEKRRRKIGL